MDIKYCLIFAGVLFFKLVSAEAGICDRGGNFNFSEESLAEEKYYREIFPDDDYSENRSYNKVIPECNRKRDTKGNEIQKALNSELA